MPTDRSVIGAVRWAAIGQGARALVGLAQLLVLSRYLAPSDFGLIAIIGAVITITQILADSGVGNALIHEQYVEDDALSSVYWINLGVAIALAILLLLFAPILATAYRRPELVTAMTGCAFAFLLLAASQQFRVLAEKRLEFRKLACIDAVGVTIGFACAWRSATYGLGVHALVIGQIVAAAATLALSLILLRSGWRLSMRIRFTEFIQFARFGIYSVLSQLVNAVNAQADLMVGGRTLDADALGRYGVARDLGLRVGQLLNPIATRVGFPVLASLQADEAAVRRVFLKVQLMVCSINAPIYLGVSAFAPDIVRIAFDPSWEEVGTLLQVLALIGLIRSAFNPLGSLILSAGRPEVAFRWNVGQLLLFPVFALTGSAWGSIGLATSLLLLQLLLLLPAWYFIVKPLCSAKLAEYLSMLARPLLLAAIATSIATAIAAPFVHSAVRLTLALPVFLAAYAGLSSIFNRDFFTTILSITGSARRKVC